MLRLVSEIRIIQRIHELIEYSRAYGTKTL